MASFDILLLGATGYTGRIITRYLAQHPQRNQFSVGLGARSSSKLVNLVAELGLDGRKGITLVEVDVGSGNSIKAAVSRCKVVINTVGPFWTWGTPVVKACVAQGKHYVDLTGEAAWTRDIIDQFDYAATNTGAIIVPSCGFDSLPSDLIVYVANKTLKGLLGENAGIDESITAWKAKGGVSGGTFSTLVTLLEEVPTKKLKAASQDYALSPIKGVPSTSAVPKLFNTLPHSDPPVYGGYFVMESANRSVLHRSWGLNELAGRQDGGKKTRLLSYGDKFKYSEFLVTPNRASAIAMNLIFFVIGLGLLFPPFLWLFKNVIPQPGSGDSDEKIQTGWLIGTNITTSVPSSSSPRTTIRTVIRGRGDPGYLLTATMIAESALALLLSHDSLPEFARKGGVLTPSTAFGDIIVQRLKETGQFDFESEVLLGGAAEEARKTR